MAGLFNWSSTAGSNATVDGVNIAEGCPAGNLNNGIRSVMALIRATFSATLEGFLAGTSALGLSSGGTGATTAADARTNLGLGTAATESTMPVAKGGTGVTTITAASVALGVIGISQSWQDVTGSRSVNTTYQNTTGRPIMVSVNADAAGDTDTLRVSSDGGTFILVGTFRFYGTVQAIIPAGHYYRAEVSAATVLYWTELR